MRIQDYLLLALLFLLPAVFSHEAGGEVMAEQFHTDSWSYIGIPNQLNILFAASLISGLAIFYAIFVKNSSERIKKLVYLFIAVPIAASTLYLMGATVYQNLVSVSGGPVHWHADYEVWACGEKFEQADPTGLSNFVGTSLIHEHNDNRIHVEGVLLKKEQASLRSFFVAVGGDFDGDSLTFPTNKGIYTWNNGDKCNGLPAKWYVFVNGKMLGADAHDYEISPYTMVPPGDEIKFVFTEKPSSQINPEIGGSS